MYPHRIRLRGPWQWEPREAAADTGQPLPARCQYTLPGTGLADFAGTVRWSRAFGFPGRIDADERVWLVIDRAATTLTVNLNGQPLEGEAGTNEFEVTALLRARNQLQIEMQNVAREPWAEVALEVRCTAYLRGLSCRLIPRADGKLAIRAHGEIAGNSTESLELYLLFDRRTVAYEELAGPVRPQPFLLESAELASERFTSGAGGGALLSVRVELVRASTVWYTWEQELTQ